MLVLDDTTFDKQYSKKITLVTSHWSGKHHHMVGGINLITLLWTDGEKLVPTGHYVYDKPFGRKTKNEPFGDMLHAARGRGLLPDYTVFDSWYTSLDYLGQLKEMEWRWFVRMKVNRLVCYPAKGPKFRAISDIEIPAQGR